MSEQVKAPKQWASVEFETSAANEDLASWLIIKCGASGCEVVSAGGDPKGGKIKISASFDKSELSEDDLSKLRASFEEYGLGECLLTLRIASIEEEDWLSKWKDGFEPFAVGDRLMICPSWYKQRRSELPGDRVCIFIEPGMAFGTGLHETTRYCLSALERFSTGQTVLDVGTGSGILAMAAALLSDKADIVALDNDPLAIENARHNLELNGLERRIDLVEGELEKVDNRKFDTILSNLTCEDIIALLPQYAHMLNPGGCLICAGILIEKLDRLVPELEGNGMETIDDKLSGQWVGLTLGHAGPNNS